MALGHFCMAFPTDFFFYGALGLLIMGNGFFKPNISTLVGSLYEEADGAMRDSLSLFDRLVSFSESNLTYQGVIEHLNILDYDYYFNITSSLLNNDINALLIIFNEILENGFDGDHFINGLADHIRDLLVSKDNIFFDFLDNFCLFTFQKIF